MKSKRKIFTDELVGHGAYPFWAGSEGAKTSAPIEVWYSEALASEKFYHASCHLDEVKGPSGGPAPCFHLMTGTVHPHGPPRDEAAPRAAKAYLYSADSEFCCKSSGSPEDLSAPKSDFMDKMTLDANRTSVTTEFYDGPARWFAMKLDKGELVSDFWYVTTPDGRPLQQGEGGTGPASKTGRGNLVYHDYNVTSWGAPEAPFDAAIFDVPAACQATEKHCAFP